MAWVQNIDALKLNVFLTGKLLPTVYDDLAVLGVDLHSKASSIGFFTSDESGARS